MPKPPAIVLPPGHKLGANKHDPARPQKAKANNFKQSRDIREDRGTLQHKNAPTLRRTGSRSR